MEPGQVSISMFVLMWTLTGWCLLRFQNSNQRWPFWFTVRPSIFHGYALTFCWGSPHFLSSTASLFGCTSFCNIACLFCKLLLNRIAAILWCQGQRKPQSIHKQHLFWHLYFETKLLLWPRPVRSYRLHLQWPAGAENFDLIAVFSSFFFLKFPVADKGREIGFGSRHALESQFRDGLFEKRKKYPDTFEFRSCQERQSSASDR